LTEKHVELTVDEEKARVFNMKARNHPCPSLERRGAGTEAYRCLKAFGGHLFLMRL